MRRAQRLLGVVERAAHLQVDGASAPLDVALCLTDRGFREGDLALRGGEGLVAGLLVGAQGRERGIDGRLGTAQVLERSEWVAVVCQGSLRLGDRGARVGDERVEGCGIGVEALDIRQVRRNRTDGGGQAVADRVEVGLGGEDRVRLVVGHRQGAVCGVEGAGRAGAVRVHHLVGGIEGGARRGQQGGRLLGVVLEGGKHLRGVDASDGGQLGLCALEVGEFLREALACLADAFGQRRLLRALGGESGLDLAERVQVCAQVTHELLRELQALGRGCRVVHTPLKIEAARDGCLRILDRPGEFVR